MLFPIVFFRKYPYLCADQKKKLNPKDAAFFAVLPLGLFFYAVVYKNIVSIRIVYKKTLYLHLSNNKPINYEYRVRKEI